MREIKFRGYSKELNKWFFGALDNSLNWAYFIIVHENGFGIKNRVDSETIGQFTGLYDVKNKPIYEGDILEVLYYNHTGKNCTLIQEVYYLEESGCFCVRTLGKEVSPIESDRNNVPLSWTSQPNTIKCLGNIHENPELLTQHKN
jgi:uncharacterized phage protein (TIGR01671 family)